jgi:hypothetical protein
VSEMRVRRGHTFTCFWLHLLHHIHMVVDPSRGSKGGAAQSSCPTLTQLRATPALALTPGLCRLANPMGKPMRLGHSMHRPATPLTLYVYVTADIHMVVQLPSWLKVTAC